MAITYQSGEIEYTPEDKSDPNIIDVEWLDADGKPIGTKNINGTAFSDIRYGEKVKVKVTFDKKPTNKRVTIIVKSKGTTIDEHGKQTMKDLDAQILGSEIPGFDANETEAISEAFVLPITLYRDNFEDYDYTAFKTGVKNPQELYIRVNSTTFFYKEEKHKLKPYTYFRNYEELLGLFCTDDSGNKDFKDNYESKFIANNASISSIVKEFIQKLAEIKKEETTSSSIKNTDNNATTANKPKSQLERIKELIEGNDVYRKNKEKIKNGETVTPEDKAEEIKPYTKLLWEASLNQTDDRPLYWARNKMQAYLKRHIAFKDDYDQETSRVKEKSELANQIKRFEELSRNYKGVDFSGANGKRKMLLTGFDPFYLDSISKHPRKTNNNIFQSNTAGCVALNLHGKTVGDYYIQTMIFPLRYKDFGTGNGVVEEYIQKYVDSFSDTDGDIIMTQSQGWPFIFDIEYKAGIHRGSNYDNMYAGEEYDSTDFEQLTTGDDFYYTTVPVNNMLKSASNNLFIVNENCSDRVEPTSTTKGSGSDYLSNEIYYRVARMRAKSKPKLQTGHIHVPMLQASKDVREILINYYKIKNSNLITKDINSYISDLIAKNKEIIENIL